MSGRRVLVTGASSGLGAHMAAALARAGARVVAAARRTEALARLAQETGGAATPVAMDVTDPASVAAGVEFAVEALGGLDGLVNNAGVAWGGPALDMPDAAFAQVMAVNVHGAFRVAQAAARAMAAGEGGAIVNMASIQGFGTGRGVAAYAASKAAVIHLTRSLAVEWARHGVRVNALAPGYFPTEMTEGHLGEAMLRKVPLRRFGRPEDLDGPLFLLLSDASAYMTGAIIPVDGGHLVTPLT
ncbi:SDR family NAD(P)-dependent oxidoreductase [Rubrimonas cliftonensis]|nr:glucose 1-dehydrogenase [Rubrimonas cliftonensis]